MDNKASTVIALPVSVIVRLVADRNSSSNVSCASTKVKISSGRGVDRIPVIADLSMGFRDDILKIIQHNTIQYNAI
jgi:hypothetical protein